MSERETVTSGLPLDADVGPGDEDDEIVFGFTLEEMFLTANGIMALALAYMAILARSDKLPYLPRHSFYDHVVADHAANSTSDSHSLPVELVRAFFAQAGQTHGGMFVVNSLFALFAALTLSLSVELSRTRLTRSVGPSSASRLAAWFPVACQGVGVSGMFPWAWAWVIKQKRRFPTPRSVNNDVSPPHALLACAAALTLVGLQHLMALLPDRTEVLLAFLGVPVVLPLFGLALPHPEEPSSSPQAQRLTAFAVIATFLCLGTHGW